MTDIAFNAKNGIVANGVFTANSTLVSANGFTANLSVFSITSNVGIGTLAPGLPLSVVGNSYVTGTVSIGYNSNAYSGSLLTLIPAVTPTTVADAKQLTIGENTHNSPYNLAIGYATISSTWQGVIQATAAGTATPLILNPSGGNIGIGKSSPAYTLDVFGNVSFSNTLIVTGNTNFGNTVNAFAYTVGSSFVANSTGITGTLLTVSQPNITANNSTYLGGIIASSYQLNSTLAANVATITANNSTNFAGLSLSTIQGYITANAATAYTNAVNYTSTNYAALSGATFTGNVAFNNTTLALLFPSNAGNDYQNRIFFGGTATAAVVWEYKNPGTNYSYGVYDNNSYTINGVTRNPGYMFQHYGNSFFQLGYGSFTGNSSGVNAVSFNVGSSFTANTSGVYGSVFNTTAASTGTTTLPGGVILKWGTGSTIYPSGSGSGVARVLFNTSFPNACDNVTVSINAGTATASLNALIVGGLDGSNIPPGAGTPTANGFSVYTTTGVNVGFFWHAIGR
jgi:hypothetical protein